jgi:hypothetical protein
LDVRMPPKKHRPAWRLAWLFSILAVVLAIGPNIRGSYDPNLAVLTLTLIAVIWYTYFAYQSVNPYVRTVIRTELTGEASPTAIKLYPLVHNDSPNHVSVRCELDIWIDDALVAQDDFYSGNVDQPIPPREFFRGATEFKSPPLPEPRKDERGIWPAYAQCRVRLIVFWTDQYGESDIAHVRHYRADMQGDRRFAEVVTEPEITRWFGALEAPSRIYSIWLALR